MKTGYIIYKINYTCDGTWWLKMNVLSTLIRGGTHCQNNVLTVCTNKLGCACRDEVFMIGPSKQISDFMMGRLSCIDGYSGNLESVI